jgi:hypothetical protein
MTVTVNGARGSNAINANSSAGVAITFNYNCPAGTDCLVLFEGGNANATPPQVPTAVSYNGLAMTSVAGSSGTNSFAGVFYEMSCYYLLMPPTGSSLVLSITYAQILQEQITGLIPLIGVSQSAPTGLVTLGNSGTVSANPAVTGSGGGASDLYLGCVLADPTAVAGGGQTSLISLASRSTVLLEVSDIPGSSPGAFAWTAASAQWLAAAIPFLAVSAAPPSVPLLGQILM